MYGLVFLPYEPNRYTGGGVGFCHFVMENGTGFGSGYYYNKFYPSKLIYDKYGNGHISFYPSLESIYKCYLNVD